MPGGQTMKSDIVLGNTAQLEKMNEDAAYGLYERVQQ